VLAHFLRDAEAVEQACLDGIGRAADPAALEQVRVEYLGRRGRVQELLGRLGGIAAEERPEAGQRANRLKRALEEALAARRAELERPAVRPAGPAAAADVTMPGRTHGAGAAHPISQVMDLLVEILGRMGFAVADGPDVETAYHNFDALNTPEEHPSRDPQDTFYLPEGTLLRTQTSPVQIRVMERTPPPVRIIAPGRCYRRDTADATHSASFQQIEGLYVDEQVSLADLKGTLQELAHQLFGAAVQVRFRPHFFPFTEPSIECDFSCTVCRGRGCRVCKQSGWLEIAGAGMVDPRVFSKIGYDPERYTGFAFGMGIERIAMILFGLNDIRLLYENDLRFIEQFRARFHEADR